METQIKTSSQFSINWRDLGQTGLYAFIAALVGFLGDFIVDWATTSTFAVDITQLTTGLKFALVTGIAAIIQKFRESNKIILTNVPKEIVNEVKANAASITVNTQSSMPLTVSK